MNVYDEIAANDRRTLFLLLAFPVALFIIVFLILALLANINVLPPLESSYASDSISKGYEMTLKIFPWIVLAAFLWIAFSFYSGGEMILNIANARPVEFDENRELFRLVENTAIMIGLPTPKIYLIEDESLNAFATGRNPETASIALTDGIVKVLDKSELQSVIAHELAHISNHDTRLMLIIVAGIGCFMFFGQLLCRTALRSSRGRGKSSGKGAALILALGIACLIFGCLVAPILRFALSRRREYQADATAVRTTRDPEALIRALTKIAEDPRVEVLDASSLAGNMCIANPAELGFFTRLYSTHPPIEDRIAALGGMTVRGK